MIARSLRSSRAVFSDQNEIGLQMFGRPHVAIAATQQRHDYCQLSYEGHIFRGNSDFYPSVSAVGHSFFAERRLL